MEIIWVCTVFKACRWNWYVLDFLFLAVDYRINTMGGGGGGVWGENFREVVFL